MPGKRGIALGLQLFEGLLQRRDLCPPPPHNQCSAGEDGEGGGVARPGVGVGLGSGLGWAGGWVGWVGGMTCLQLQAVGILLRILALTRLRLDFGDLDRHVVDGPVLVHRFGFQLCAGSVAQRSAVRGQLQGTRHRRRRRTFSTSSLDALSRACSCATSSAMRCCNPRTSIL